MQPVVELSGVCFSYPGAHTALCGVDLSLQAGERLAVVGPNGAGKTTLLLVLAGLLRPMQGKIKLFGAPVKPGDPAAVRADLGFVFHYAEDQLFMPSVLEDVAFGLAAAKEPPAAARGRAQQQLDELGIGELGQRFPGHLSAGEKRLAAIAGVLVMQPRILVFDEPTASLDPFSRRRVINTLQNMQQTQLIVTHDLELVLETCTRACIMMRGRCSAEGRPAELFRDRQLMERHRLEVPYSLHGR